MRVLLIEDDRAAAQNIELVLKHENMVVDVADYGEEGLDLARNYDYDIIVLDIMLPDMTGYEVLKKIRGSKNTTPVLILSGLSGADKKVQGLTSGADDYLTKPFDRQELVARINAIVLRSRGHAEQVIQIGNMEINVGKHTVSVKGKPIHLTGKETSILELMAMRKGVTVSKDQFLNNLYGGIDEPEQKIIDVFMCKLRKKLIKIIGEDYIKTDWGRGYHLQEPKAGRKKSPKEGK